MEKSLQFYKNLGFKTPEKESDPPVVFFNNAGTKLELFPLDALAKDINPTNPPSYTSGFSGITLAITLKSKDEVDALMEKVAEHGGKIAKSPQEVFWGGYSGYFQDLDGYYWEVAYAKDWNFDEQNMLIIE